MTPKRILCAASFAYGVGSTSWHRIEAIKKLGHDVTFVDSMPRIAIGARRLLPIRAAIKYWGLEIDWGRINWKLTRLIRRYDYDVFWIDKGTHIKPSVFRIFRERFPNGKIIGYSPDDMMVRANKSKNFISSLPSYDIFFTTKSFHLVELKDLGCTEVRFIDNAYHEDLHCPLNVTTDERKRLGHEVIFIGAYEEERASYIQYLAENVISVRVWGDSVWKTIPDPHPLMRLESRPLFSKDYTKALCASNICLCFLRKLNRDFQTTRSIEIPACGTLMMAERTHEHLALFKEGKEAVFFESKEELLEKTRFYLEHSVERNAIAEAGRSRCVTGGYSNLERMRTMMDIAFRHDKATGDVST